MHRIIAFLIVLLLIGSCKKEDGGNNNTSNPCATPSLSLNALQGGTAIFVSSSGDQGFFEIEYGSNGFSKGSGTTKTVNNQSDLTNLTNGTYDIYIRGNCGGTSWSDWSSPKSFLVQDGNSNTCSVPGNLRMSRYLGYGLYWDGQNAGYYEVEYGPTGFARGNGTKKTVSSNTYTGGSFNGNTTYDFYVRANCGGTDFSPWAGPSSFYADNPSHTCQAPINLTAYRSGGYIQFDFTPNGEYDHEVYVNNAPSTSGGTLIANNTGGGAITGIYSNVTYYIYVRSICQDGGRTAWTGPVVVN